MMDGSRTEGQVGYEDAVFNVKVNNIRTCSFGFLYRPTQTTLIGRRNRGSDLDHYPSPRDRSNELSNRLAAATSKRTARKISLSETVSTGAWV